MKIYILLGHPDKDSLNGGVLADAYERAAIEKGHDVRRQNLGEMQLRPHPLERLQNHSGTRTGLENRAGKHPMV